MKNKSFRLIKMLLILALVPSDDVLADSLRSPLQPMNDNFYIIQPLQKISIAELKMVGVLRSENKIWALLSTSTNKIYPINIGMKIGIQQGKVVAITDDQITVVETTTEGKNIQTHEVSLKLEQ